MSKAAKTNEAQFVADTDDAGIAVQKMLNALIGIRTVAQRQKSKAADKDICAFEEIEKAANKGIADAGLTTDPKRIEKIIKRPFRPFAVRLINGCSYEFKTEKDLGHAKDNAETIFYFGSPNGWTMINSAHIVEIIDL